MTMDKVRISYSSDDDGFQLDVENKSNNAKRSWRFDRVKDSDNKFIRYDLMRKPTTRTHEVVECVGGFDVWVDDHAELLAQGVM